MAAVARQMSLPGNLRLGCPVLVNLLHFFLSRTFAEIVKYVCYSVISRLFLAWQLLLRVCENSDDAWFRDNIIDESNVVCVCVSVCVSQRSLGYCWRVEACLCGCGDGGDSKVNYSRCEGQVPNSQIAFYLACYPLFCICAFCWLVVIIIQWESWLL